MRLSRLFLHIKSQKNTIPKMMSKITGNMGGAPYYVSVPRSKSNNKTQKFWLNQKTAFFSRFFSNDSLPIFLEKKTP